MTAENQDVTDYYAGDSLIIRVTVTDDTGATISITGASVEWALSNDYDRTEHVYKSTAEGTDSIAITDGANGVFEIYIQPKDTDDLTPRTYVHEAELTDKQGNVSTVLTGEFVINASRV